MSHEEEVLLVGAEVEDAGEVVGEGVERAAHLLDGLVGGQAQGHDGAHPLLKAGVQFNAHFPNPSLIMFEF